MAAQSRRGASLVELLVAIAVIAVLVALLLAAVQQVRGAAARTTCGNNLRQLALALHQYHDTDGAFPPAVKTRRAGTREPYLSWRARVLPFLEQQPLWDRTTAAYQSQPNPFDDPVHVGREAVLPVLGCPTDARLATGWAVTTRRGRVVRVALTSYLGVSGTETARRDGVLYPDARVRLVEVVDGASSTLLLGERPPSRDLIYGWWYAGSGQGAGLFDSHLGVVDRNRLGSEYHGCPPGPYDFRPRTPADDCSAFGFWSTHPGGAYFAIADGSVRFLTFDAASVLPALATRAGGEVAVVP